MKIRTVFITAASVVAFGSTAMSDDHLVNALEHGLQPDRPAVILDKGKGQGSPFAGEDRVTPASEANEEFPNVNTKDHCLDPRNPHCTLP